MLDGEPHALGEQRATCLGGPLDGRTIPVRDLVPVVVEGRVVGWLAEGPPEPTDEGCYVLIEPEPGCVVWTVRD